MAAHHKKARRQHAHLVLIDESGLLMAPLARRTRSPQGQTPALIQRSGHREKVSVAAALGLSPRRDRLGLFSRTLVNDYFDPWYSTASLEALLGELAGRVVVIWDRGNMHKGDPIRPVQDVFADRLGLEELPPYAATLHPVESLWSRLKWERWSNFAPQNALELNERVVAVLTSVRAEQEFLRNLFHASELPLPRALLS